MPSHNYPKDIFEQFDIELCELENLVKDMQNAKGGYFPTYQKAHLPHDLFNGQGFHVEEGQFCVYVDGSIYCMPTEEGGPTGALHDLIVNPWVLSEPTSKQGTQFWHEEIMDVGDPAAEQTRNIPLPGGISVVFAGPNKNIWYAYDRALAENPPVGSRAMANEAVEGIYFCEHVDGIWIPRGVVGDPQNEGYMDLVVGLPSPSTFFYWAAQVVNSSILTPTTQAVYESAFSPIYDTGMPNILSPMSKLAYEPGYHRWSLDDLPPTIATDGTYIYCISAHFRRQYFTGPPGYFDPTITDPISIPTYECCDTMKVWRYAAGLWSVIGTFNSAFPDNFEPFTDLPTMTGSPGTSFGPGVDNSLWTTFGITNVYLNADPGDVGHPIIIFNDASGTTIIGSNLYPSGVGVCYTSVWGGSTSEGAFYIKRFNGSSWVDI